VQTLKEQTFVEFIGEYALSLVLFREGLELNLRSFRANIRSVIILASLGVILTAVVFAGFVSLFTPVSYLMALLIAGILAPTDPAATFAMFKGSIRIKPKEQNIIGNESALNDAVAIVLVTTIFVESVRHQHFSFNGQVVVDLLTSFFGAILLGYLLAMLFLYFNTKLEKNLQTNFISFCLVSISFAVAIHLSSLGIQISAAITSLSAGIVFGNPKMFNFKEFSQKHLHEFNASISEFAEIIAFVTIGTLMTFDNVWYSLLLGAVFTIFILLSRVLVVSGVLRRYTKMEFRESIFVSWAGMRGLATGVLVTIAIIELPTSFDLVSINQGTFVNSIMIALILTTIIQSYSMMRVGRYTQSLSSIDRKDELQVQRRIITSKLSSYRQKFDQEKISQDTYRSRTIPLRDQLDKIVNELHLERQQREERISRYLSELETNFAVKEEIASYVKKTFETTNMEDVPGYNHINELEEEQESLIDEIATELDRLEINLTSENIPKEKREMEDIVEKISSSLQDISDTYDTEAVEPLVRTCQRMLHDHDEASEMEQEAKE